jgi:hypothetical protein
MRAPIRKRPAPAWRLTARKKAQVDEPAGSSDEQAG